MSIMHVLCLFFLHDFSRFFFFKQKTAYEMRISDWSSDVCSSYLHWRWNGLRRRWSIPERAVRPDGVVMSPPGFDQDAGLGERVEYLAIEQFIAQRPVEALAVSILPWRSGGDVERLHADLRQPFLHRDRKSTRLNSSH